MSKTIRTPFYRDLILIFAGGLLAILGALFNTYITARNEDEAWKKRTQLELKQKLFDQKIKLVERTVQILNKIGWVKMNVRAGNATGDISPHGKIIYDLTSEFMTVISLNSMCFGPKVKEVHKKIKQSIISKNGQWWAIDTKLKDEYLESMREELERNSQAQDEI